MKGYYDSKEKILYIFPQEVGTIPNVDAEAEAIAIQQENLAEWKEANEDYAALMFAYNYIMMTAKPKIWADHLDDDIVEPEPEPTYYDILLADDGVTAGLVTVDKVTAAEGDTVTITPLDTLATLTVTDEDSEEVVVTQDSSLYTFEMPASDVIIAATAAEEPVEKIDPELDWGDSVCTVGIDDADPQFLTLTNEYNVSPIVYSSSDSQVATIDAQTGFITLVAEGTTDITAEFAGNDEYEADSVTYELTVEAAHPELPEEGTLYDFIGYLTEDAEQPSSTGTITYEGEYSGNTDYVYGTATVTFVGSETPQELTVYMTKEGFITTLEGGRAQVYTLQDSDFVSLGWGELTEHVP